MFKFDKTSTMTISAIREKVKEYIDVADIKKVKAVYALLDLDEEYTEEFKTELDNRHESYYDGTAKIVSAAESEKRISAILRKSQ